MSKRLCSIEDCEKKHWIGGYCKRHFWLWKTYGVPWSLSNRYKRTPEERFWEKVDKSGPNHPRLGTPCWVWTGSTNFGYGQFNLDGRTRPTHRVSHFFTYGKWPDLDVLHHCDNRPCVNPAHLYEGTDKDNARDREERGRRCAKGELNPRAKLNRGKVAEARVRRQRGEKLKDLAAEFGVHISTMGIALRTNRWD